MHNLELPPFSGPEIAGPARSEVPFALAGQQSLATGTEADGVEELRVHPCRALRRLRVAGAEALAVRATPSGLERRLRVDGREVLERIFVPAAAPGAVLEWEMLPDRATMPASAAPFQLELTWSCDLDDGAAATVLRAETGGQRLTVTAKDGRAALFEASRGVATAVQTAPPNAPGSPGMRCRLRASLGPGERFQLLVAAALDGAGLERAYAALADAGDLVRARAAAAQRRLDHGLVVGAPEPVAGLAVRWATLRLGDFLADLDGRGSTAVAAGYAAGHRPAASPAAALRIGLAALAAGDRALALECARGALATARADEGVPPGYGAAPALLLHAEHFLWTADPEPLLAGWASLLALVPRVQAAARGPTGAAALSAAALARLARAADSLGKDQDAATLRALAAPLAHGHTVARALADAGGWGEWLEADARAAADAWLSHAAAGLDRTRAFWRGPAGTSEAAATAEVVCGVARGMLGIAADAPRSRMRLRPRLPDAWEYAEFERIRVGDAEMKLSYLRSEGVHRFQIEPLAGAMPLRVAFDAVVPGTVRGTRIDGASASVEPARWGERALVPVHFVLDGPRVMEVDVEN